MIGEPEAEDCGRSPGMAMAAAPPIRGIAGRCFLCGKSCGGKNRGRMFEASGVGWSLFY